MKNENITATAATTPLIVEDKVTVKIENIARDWGLIVNAGFSKASQPTTKKEGSKQQAVSDKEALQRAADEARKAARAAREFASILDDYAKYPRAATDARTG